MKHVSILLIAALFLNGCASMSDGDQTRAQGAGFGALIGAGIGALVSDNKAQGALIGGAIGALGGLAFGDHVAKKKDRYASQEDYLDACIAAADQRYRESIAFNEGIRTDIASMQREMETLTASTEQSKQEQGRLREIQKSLAQKIKESDRQMIALNDEILIQKEVYKSEVSDFDEPRAVELDRQIALLEEQKAELEIQTQQLAGLNNRFAS